jgi:hypothetical protein
LDTRPLNGRLERLPSSWQGMYLAYWKGFLPAGKVNVPRRLEGVYLVDWKETLPVGEVIWFFFIQVFLLCFLMKAFH